MPCPKRSSISGDGCSLQCSFYAVQGPGHRKCLSSHLKAPQRLVLPVLQGHGKPAHQRQQDGALPSQLPAQDILCQSGAEEGDSAAPAAAAQVREPHSLTPRSRTEWRPAVPALHDAACPAPAPSAARLLRCGSPPNSLLDLSWGHILTLHSCHLAVYRCTCRGAKLPLALCSAPPLDLKFRKGQPSRALASFPSLTLIRALVDLHTRATSTKVKGSTSSSSTFALMLRSIGRGCLRLVPCGAVVQQRFSKQVLPLLQEVVSFRIPEYDEGSEAGSDPEAADDALLSDQQPAKQHWPEGRQHLPTAEPTPDDKAAEQVRQPLIPSITLIRALVDMHTPCYIYTGQGQHPHFLNIRVDAEQHYRGLPQASFLYCASPTAQFKADSCPCCRSLSASVSLRTTRVQKPAVTLKLLMTHCCRTSSLQSNIGLKGGSTCPQLSPHLTTGLLSRCGSPPLPGSVACCQATSVL